MRTLITTTTIRRFTTVIGQVRSNVVAVGDYSRVAMSRSWYLSDWHLKHLEPLAALLKQRVAAEVQMLRSGISLRQPGPSPWNLMCQPIQQPCFLPQVSNTSREI